MEHTTKIWADGGVGHYTHQENMYLKFLKSHLPNFKGGSVLEIGPGTGKFATMLMDEFDITQYTVLDLAKNINDSVTNIKDKTGITVNSVTSENYTDLFNTEFDLIVSNVCIPETPKEYREHLLNNIIPNSNNAMIIGQLTGSWVEGSEYHDWIMELFYNSFKNVMCEITPYKNCHALTGNNKN